jgi:hypothetical protein
VATFVYNGEEPKVFPTLFDADGNVLVVNKGDVFDAPDDLVAEDVAPSTGKASKAKASTPAPDATPSTPDVSADAPADEPTTPTN